MTGEARALTLALAVVLSAACSKSSSPLDRSGTGSGTTGVTAAGGSGASRPATCEGAVDRYLELYTEDARATGRDAQAVQVAAKRETFIEDCKQRVADGRFTPEQLACAANAPTLEAGAACAPQEPASQPGGSGSGSGSGH